MTIDELLEELRRRAGGNKAEQGRYFEDLSIAFLLEDPVYAEQYSEVYSHADWAAEHGYPASDTGIDLVGKLRDGEGFVAIQCKFHQQDRKIQKKDIDSFLSASGKEPFVLRLFIDTTGKEWSAHAEDTIKDQVIEVRRIGLAILRKSSIDWSKFLETRKLSPGQKKKLRPYQEEAIEKIETGFKEQDRGKLIMACGTGKTFTSLRAAEQIAGRGKRVLFLAPSLALVSQAVREWSNDAEVGLRSFAVCSDSQIGRKSKKDDTFSLERYDLEFPAMTDEFKLAEAVKVEDSERMTVVFATYHSVKTIKEAQQIKEGGLPDFDLIICDEAHRTTGARLSTKEERLFTLIHKNEHVRGAKRLYMTATPRVYGEKAKAKAKEKGGEEEILLCSMDDEELYGKEFYRRGFGWAVSNGYLTDYKVVVLMVDEGIVNHRVQSILTSGDNELVIDEAAKIVGCYMAMNKEGSKKREDFKGDPTPMSRVLAFSNNIESSKLITREFERVVKAFREYVGKGGKLADKAMKFKNNVECKVQHIDGTHRARAREDLLYWLKEDGEGGCM